MSARISPYRNGGWEVDILLQLPDGSAIRERRVVRVSSKSLASRWARDRERELLTHGPRRPKKEVPTLAEFAPRFLSGHADANRHKPSGIASKDTILRVHLLPALGSKRLDAIGNEDVARLKVRLRGKAPKTVNNVLSVLGKLLRVALQWDVIERMPCTVDLVKASKPMVSFLDFDEYARLLEAAERMGPRARLLVLLAGDAGLRCGEMMALEWSDVDLGKRQMAVQRSEWKGQVTSPKGGRPRVIPLTKRLTQAMTAARHLRGPRVLCQDDGTPFTQKEVQGVVWNAARRANLAPLGPHKLRHTFCSHLSMRGAPARSIQELAGHKDLSTTQRYMHLSPAAIESAIGLLEAPAPIHGDTVEAAESDGPA